MTRTKTSTRKKSTRKPEHRAREPRTAYGKQNENGTPSVRKSRKQLVIEMRGGEPYEYYPLGRFVVIAPKVAGMVPIFKYTRIRTKRALDMIAAGASIHQVAQKLDNAFVPPEAIQEALKLAKEAFAKAHPSLRRAKRVIV